MTAFEDPHELVDAFAAALNTRTPTSSASCSPRTPSSSTSWACACGDERGLSTATAGPSRGRLRGRRVRFDQVDELQCHR